VTHVIKIFISLYRKGMVEFDIDVQYFQVAILDHRKALSNW